MRRLFERILLASNSFTLFPVIFGLLGAIMLFVIASYDVGKVLLEVYKYFFVESTHAENFHSEVVGEIVGAIDLYLMALVLYIFSFGIYELFISAKEYFMQTLQHRLRWLIWQLLSLRFVLDFIFFIKKAIKILSVFTLKISLIFYLVLNLYIFR